MSHKPELYHWKSSVVPGSTSESRIHSFSNDQRKHKLAKESESGIQNWMKTVEDVSNHAINEVFGVSRQNRKHHPKPSSHFTTPNIREHEAAYSEAQDLLNEWMKDKIRLDPEDMDFLEVYNGPTQSDIKKQWDELLTQDHYRVDNEPEAIDYNYDVETGTTDDIVNEILNNLMKKEVVNSEVKRDLGLNRKEIFDGPDPRTKMYLRHEQVKLNREKRDRERQQKLSEKQQQREVQLQAKQIVIKEGKEKALAQRHEELLVQREAARLRHALMEQRRVEDERRQKMLQQEERLRYEAQMELERQNWEEEQRELEARLREEKRRRELEVQRNLETKLAARDMKMLQRSFSAWYGLILDKRLQSGKVKAMADWKLLVRVFNSWKSYTRHKRLEQENALHQQQMKERVRNAQRARTHYERRLLKRCLSAWQTYNRQAETEREAERERDQTKNKMASFLEAAASGRLWAERKTADDHVDELFAVKPTVLKTTQPNSVRSLHSAGDQVPSSSRRTTAKVSKCKSASDQKYSSPTEAWQVSKRHIDLTPEQISELTERPKPLETPTDKKRKIHHRMHKWSPNSEASTYENRHKAQQEILKMQREQLKEQQRMIEDLKFVQTQQILQQQLTQQQLETQRLNNMIVQAQTTLKRPSSARPLGRSPSLTRIDVKTGAITERGAGDAKSSAESAHGSDDGDRRARRPSATQSSVSGALTADSAPRRHDDFVRKMEERATERARLKAERQHRKQQQEQQKLAVLRAEQEEQRQREEEERLAKIEAKREQKRLEKEREKERIELEERLKVLSLRADDHYQRSQLKFRGLLPWRRLLEESRDQWSVAELHSNSKLLRACFHRWLQNVRDLALERRIRADRFHQILIMKRCFRNWKKYGGVNSLLEDKAAKYYKRSLMWRVLQSWTNYSADEKIRSWELERISKDHNLYRIQKRALSAWRRLPLLQHQERERERRRAEMRQKVAAILPDFQKSLEV